MLALLLAAMLSSQTGADLPRRGIPDALARARSAAIGTLRYDLVFTVPDDVSQPVQGRAVVRFTLRAPHRVVLDFAQPRDHIRSVRIGVADAPFAFADGHLTIPAEATRSGENEIAIEFLAGNEPLNRDREFLYTLFVPARAHLAFPCFDQPDLKARYTLTLDVPAGWVAVSNAATAVSEARDDRTRVRFAETKPISTYLFAFVAGRFSMEAARRNDRELRMFHRETDAAKVARNRDTVFDLHAAALTWLEGYTGIPYPFGKFDIVAIPSFQFSGMEHPGAILYNAAYVVWRSGHDAVVQRRLDEGSLRELHGGQDREPVVSAGESQSAVHAGALSGCISDRSHGGGQSDSSGAHESERGRATLRAHHLPESPHRDATARDDRGRACFP
jgi:aminopeptidase N